MPGVRLATSCFARKSTGASRATASQPTSRLRPIWSQASRGIGSNVHSAHDLPGSRPEVATEDFCRAGRAGACRHGAHQRAHPRPVAPRLPADRHPRRRQDDDRPDPREEPQLHYQRGHGNALRHLRGVHGHRRGSLHRPARARCGVEYRHRQHARDPRQRALCADRRPLQGLPDRRSPHAVEGGVQLDAEDARGAARARQVRAGDDRPAEDPGDGALALPAVQSQAVAAGADCGSAFRDPRCRGHRDGSAGAGADREGCAGVDARRAVAARPGDRLRRRRGPRSPGAHHAGRGRSRIRLPDRRRVAGERRPRVACRSRCHGRAWHRLRAGARRPCVAVPPDRHCAGGPGRRRRDG